MGASCLAFFLCLNVFNFLFLFSQIESLKCPPKTFHPNCDNCTCVWSNDLDCDQENGQCKCKKGFRGRHCSEDINECFAYPGICGNQVCINNHGSYDCLPCPLGFTNHSNGKCEPCPDFTYGDDCKRECECVKDNTLYCDSSNGECFCTPGWEGSDCGQSIDDCKVNNCPDGTCEDKHLHYVCVCGDNYMVIADRCEPYIMDFISLDRTPAIGEWVDIYMFFSLPDLYYKANYLAPALTFRISDDQSKGECYADFKKQSKPINGDEPILSKIRIPKRLPYQSYIHLKRRFLKQAVTTVTANSSELHRKWNLVFDAKFKSKNARVCLENMVIPMTEMMNISKAKYHYYKRQSYLMFEVNFQKSKDCFETPRVIWEYYIMDVPDNDMFCLVDGYFHPIDVDTIAKKNRELSMSDHRQAKEIIPKNTLPLGVIMLCATAYVQRVIGTKAVVCGFIKMNPSWIIVGKLTPSSTLMTVPWNAGPYITAAFHEPDTGTELGYKWRCLTPLLACKRHINFKIPDKYYLAVPGRILKVGITYEFELEIKIIERPWKIEKRKVSIHCGENGKVNVAMLYCIDECNKRISGRNVLVLEGMVVRAERYSWSLKMESLDQRLPSILIEKESDLMKYRMQKWGERYFFTRVNTLPPGHKITIGLKGTDKNNNTSYAEYQFETMRFPSGKGCSILPVIGKAVFTKFDITCKNYRDVEAGLPLVYKLYQEITDARTGKNFMELVGYSNEGVIPMVTLSSESPNTIVKLEVHISTVFQLTVKVPLTVTLTTDDQKDILERTITDRKTLSTVGSQEELRLVKDVATVMKASATAPTETKKRVRKQLMKNMKEFEAAAGDTIEHSSSALTELAARDDEVDGHGLNDGLKAAVRITKYLGKCGGGNIGIIKDVANLQVEAMNNLVKISSDYGKGIQKNVSKQEKVKMVEEGKENSRNTISSMSQIVKTLRGGFDISNDPIKIKKDTLEVVLESKNVATENSVKMNSDNDDVSFSIQARSLNYIGNGSIETEFEAYEKSPYSWTSDRVQGDIPVMKVNFVEPYLEKKDTDDDQDNGNKKKVKRAKWQFSKPADVFLKNKKPNNESVGHSTLLFVNKYTNEVYMSSCIYLSVKASTEHVTILEITSEHNLEFVFKARYTNFISAFELLNDYDMVEIPLKHPGDTFQTKVENKTIERNNNFVFLPKLTKKQIDLGVLYYNVKISVKKGQIFKGDKGTLSPMTAEKLAKLNNMTVNYKALDLHNITVNVLNQQLSCVHFDQNKLDYSYDSCELSVFTSKTELHCRCVVAAAFSASYIVMPRLIDPTNIGLFLDVFDNPLTISMVICLWMTFLALFIWGRRKDKDDEIKRGATVLDDNKETETYVYLVCVVTGNSILAGTTSNVYIFLKGTWGKSSVHILKDSERALFTAGAENWFVLTTERDLGYLKSAVVWIDHSGGHPSWFLYSIYVQNVQTGEAWNLLYNQWLSAVKGSGQIIAEIPAAEDNIYAQDWLNKLTGKGRVDIRNEHLWFGMVFKTAYNKFTRFRRLATALSMLQALMIINLMFYGVRNLDDSRQFANVFGYRIHLTSLIIGIQSCLAMSLFGIGLSFTFNRIVPKKPADKNECPDTKATEKEIQRRKTALTYGAFQTYVGDDVDGEDAAYLWKMLLQSEKEEKEEKPEESPPAAPTSDLWFTLPWWFIYIYWGFIVVFNIFVAYYIMLFGLSLGYEKSVNWLVSFFAGFAFNVLLVQPLKVVGMVMFLVLVFQQTYSLKDMAPFNNMVDASKAIKKQMQKARNYSAIKSTAKYQRPPNVIQIGAILDRLGIEMTAREMLRDLLLYSVFLTALITMIYRHSQITDAYKQTLAMNKILFKADFSEEGDETSVLDGIYTVEDIWTFLETGLLPFLIKEEDDNLDLNSFYFAGTARIRQVRVKRNESSCDTIPIKLMDMYQREHCAVSMSDGEVETRDFNNSWLDPINQDRGQAVGIDDEDEESNLLLYHYRTADELKTTPITGPHATYPGGGYVFTIQRDDLMDALVSVQKYLASSAWIDHLTRCLFVEFTMYNPSSNLFTYVVTGFEFDSNGGPFPFKIVTSSRLNHYGNDRSFTQITEVVVMVCSAFYTVIVFQTLIRCGPAAFFTFIWNWVDLLILGLIYTLAYAIHERDASMVSVLAVFAQYGNNRFLDFQAVFHKDFIVSLVEGFVGAAAFLKLIFVLRFNPFSKTFMKSVDIAKSDVVGYTVMTALYLIGFSLSGMMILGRNMEGYHSFDRSLLSLLFFLLGEPNFPSLVAANRFMGPIFFLMVMVVTQYIILNFFIAMIRDGLDMARSMEFGKKDATMRYMLDTIKLYLGIGSNRQINVQPS